MVAKLDRAQSEMSKLDEYLGQASSRTPTPQESWARTKLMANSVADVYNGMEEVMQDIATLVDNYVPTGERWHQDLIDQLATAVRASDRQCSTNRSRTN